MGPERSVTEQERDAGELVERSRKVLPPCVVAAKKANAILGVIRKGIVNKMAKMMMPLYKRMVRPQLESLMRAQTPLGRA